MDCLTKSPLQERVLRLEKLRVVYIYVYVCVCVCRGEGVWKVLAEIACIDVGRDWSWGKFRLADI